VVWARKFDEPISLPDGRKLIRLRDAADYIIALPTETANLPDWQLAMEALSLVSESGPNDPGPASVPKGDEALHALAKESDRCT
jgi:hypothetical protein